MSAPASPPNPSLPPVAPDRSHSSGATCRGLLDRLSLGGKLMLGGAALSVLAFFLKAFSASAHTNLGELAKGSPLENLQIGGISSSVMMFATWHGIVAMLGCVATGILAFLVFGERPHAKTREFSLGALATSGVALVVSLILLFSMGRGQSFSGPGAEWSAGPGMGAYLMIVAAAVCLAGSVLHARAAKLF